MSLEVAFETVESRCLLKVSKNAARFKIYHRHDHYQLNHRYHFAEKLSHAREKEKVNTKIICLDAMIVLWNRFMPKIFRFLHFYSTHPREFAYKGKRYPSWSFCLFASISKIAFNDLKTLFPPIFVSWLQRFLHLHDLLGTSLLTSNGVSSVDHTRDFRPQTPITFRHFVQNFCICLCLRATSYTTVRRINFSIAWSGAGT